VLDFDGDLSDRLAEEGRTSPVKSWACFHTSMRALTLDGVACGIVPRTIGGPYAVLVAEQLWAAGAKVIVGITSAGRISSNLPLPSILVVDEAVRDEGTSLHYVSPSATIVTPTPRLAELLTHKLGAVASHVRRGTAWTTDAPYRETPDQLLIRGVDGLTDLRAEQLTGLPQLQIAVSREASARVGLAPGDVIRAVRIGLVGEEASQIWIGQRRFDLLVRLRDDRRDTLDAIRTLLIDGHDGTRIPLGQLADVTQTFGPAAIRREAGTRRIAVEATVSGRDLGSTASDVRRILSDQLKLPSGYFFDLGGRVESQARASRALTLAIGAALFGVFVLLLVALGSAVEAGMILGTVPIAFVGGILALILAGETWNVSSLVGLIGLFGIAVQNSLVLVTQTRGLLAEGRSLPEAVREASIGRVRPKLMTAGTATLGLLPMLVLRLHGTEIERPLAVVMIGGLVTSTLFTLLVLPTFYLQVHGWLERRALRAEA
jgi:hypothetical protein